MRSLIGTAGQQSTRLFRDGDGGGVQTVRKRAVGLRVHNGTRGRRLNYNLLCRETALTKPLSGSFHTYVWERRRRYQSYTGTHLCTLYRHQYPGPPARHRLSRRKKGKERKGKPEGPDANSPVSSRCRSGTITRIVGRSGISRAPPKYLCCLST